jgi:RNA polymerase sigma-70 factor (ECF subfamily)
MGDHDEFVGLMKRLHRGSEKAAHELFLRYAPHIQRVVRRKLNKRLRSRFDSTDFVQDVWASFFGDRRERRSFERPEALVAFLANMAYHKVVDAFRQQVQAQKRAASREQSLESSRVRSAALRSRLPTPSQEAIAHERWHRLLDGQPTHYQDILLMLRQGNTHKEIAQKLGLNEKTVRRLLGKLSSGTTA